MTMWRRLRIEIHSWSLGWLRLLALLLLAGELFVTAAIQRPDLLHPSAVGTDASTYYAAGQRLNVGHSLYGPLQPDDRAVPGYPKLFPAPILSPPLIAVLWRALALLPGGSSMDLWWFGGLAFLAGLTAAFALVGQRRHVTILVAVLALGLPLTLLAAGSYPYLGFNSPVSLAALSGNVNAYLVVLFALTWWASTRGSARLAGSAAALATALKLGPVVLLWWFATQGSWRTARTFIVATLVLGVAGVVFAGLQANVDFFHLAVSGSVPASRWSIPGLVHRLFNVRENVAGLGTTFAIVVGLAAIFVLRSRPRAAFAAAILTTIYSSPVVLQGNFALLVALAAPWVSRSRIVSARLDATEGPAELVRERLRDATSAQRPMPSRPAP